MNSEQTREPQILNIEVELTLRDTLRAGYQVFARRARILIVVYCGLVLAAIVFLAVASMGQAARGGAPGLVVAGITAALLLPAVAIGLIYWSAKSGFERQGAGSHQMHFHFCPDGVGVRSESTRGWFGWESLDGMLETSSSFLLFASPQEYFLIPKRCLDGGPQMSLLRAMLGRHLGQNDCSKAQH